MAEMQWVAADGSVFPTQDAAEAHEEVTGHARVPPSLSTLRRLPGTDTDVLVHQVLLAYGVYDPFIAEAARELLLRQDGVESAVNAAIGILNERVGRIQQPAEILSDTRGG